MPNEDLLAYLRPEHTRFYITQLFRNVLDIDESAQIEIRKIGKIMQADGSVKPFDESVSCGLVPQFGAGADWHTHLAEWVIRRLEQAAKGGVGAFMAPAILNDRRANDQSVRQLVSVCADFDSGNPAEKLKALNARLGFRPTFVVRSGGITFEGHPKLHVHWRLKEPCAEPWKVAYIREQIALQFGGDASFKRIPQVIRIPGAYYDKGNGMASTELIDGTDADQEVDLGDFEEVLNIDWNKLDPQSMWGQREFTKSPEQKAQRMQQLQNEVIKEGGSDTDNRWQRFSEFAGHQIRQARMRMQSVEEANTSVHLWVQNNMVPSWDRQRVENEFKALLGKDRATHADAWAEHFKPPIQLLQPLPGQQPAPVQPTEAGPAIEPVLDPNEFEIDTFDVGSLYAGKPPPVPYIIDNFLIEGAIHALVADGGVGKTYLGLDLAMRVAAGPDLQDNRFLGFDVIKKGLSIVFTVEDGKDDIHRRLVALDPHGDLRAAAAGNCFVIPVQDQLLGGLTLVERDGKGNLRPSPAWNFIITKIEACRQRSGRQDLPVFVVIDTYSATHHGDENTSTGTNEWFRAAGLLKKFNATLWIMHHVKKANPEVEIKTPSDMRNNIRGSIAFANSCRAVYGIWEMPNSDSVMKELPKETEARLFNMGLLKNNTGIDWADRSDPRYKEPMITLRRTGTGQLLYDAMIHQTRIELTHGKKERQRANTTQLKAAIVHSCKWHAENAWALTERLLTKEPERFLPSAVNTQAPKEIRKALVQLLKDGALKELKVRARGGTFTVYDVPEGPYATDKQVDRVKETPVLEWRGYRYDEEHVEYVKREDTQPVDPELSEPAQHRLDLNGWQRDD
jgi:hypothetical protein